jgi:hypothetical protein
MEVLYASPRLDIFRETTFYPSPTSMIIEMNTLYVEYNKQGKISAYNGFKTTKKIVIYENIRYVSGKEFSALSISPQMKEMMHEVENLHCFGCHTEKSAVGKWWDYLWSPIEEEQKNKLKNGTKHY